MDEQATVFLNGEGDAWHHRNSHKPRHSVILDAVMDAGISPTHAVEFGCGQGFNIAEIAHTFRCRCHGVDPSDAAIAAGREQYSPDVTFTKGTASYRFLAPHAFDLVIYGFCLYLCDRDSLHNVVGVGDRALADHGYLAIQDFDPEYSHKIPYHHAPGLFSYKMDHSKLWLSNPAYSLVSKHVYADGEAVWLLKKDVAAGWPSL